MCLREIASKIPFIGKKIKKTPVVSVIRLSGVITDNSRKTSISFNKFLKPLEKAFDVFNTKAVVLILNSPGGSPAQSQLIGNLIRQKAKEKDVAVFAFVEDVAASGGYWIACAADEIYAQETSIVGSIGVISASFGLEDFIKRYDIKRRYHTAGDNKGFMDPFLPEKEEDIARLKDLQKDLHDSFIGWVKSRRGEHLKEKKNAKLFDGSFYLGKRAIDLGLIDGLGDYRFVIKEKYGENVKFNDVTPEKGFFSNVFGGGAKADIADNLVETLKSQQLWSRFNL